MKEFKKFKETVNLKHLYRNELNKACLDHAFLVKENISDKILKDRAYLIARNCKYDGYQRALASMAYKLLIRKQDRESV